MGREGLAVRDPGEVAEEVAQLRDLGVEIIRLSHDPQMLGEKWWRKFFGLVKALDLRVYWESHRLPSRGIIEEAKRTFSMIDLAISPETASDEVRFRAKRFFTNDMLLKALDILKDERVLTEVFFLIGLPGETKDSARLIPKFARMLVEGRDNVAIYPPIPYTIDPNSPMAMRPREHGIKLFFKRLDDYRKASRGRRTIDFIGHETRELSRREIARLTEEVFRRVMEIPQEEAVKLKIEFEEGG
ncbi:MAG: hypothetical protein DRJ67_08235 [Thermoprotei archaeon]|nr:MAG: hypothetical protein DRJ67_08235 [Thermoprotei archaeon]